MFTASAEFGFLNLLYHLWCTV